MPAWRIFPVRVKPLDAALEIKFKVQILRHEIHRIQTPRAAGGNNCPLRSRNRIAQGAEEPGCSMFPDEDKPLIPNVVPVPPPGNTISARSTAQQPAGRRAFNAIPNQRLFY